MPEGKRAGTGPQRRRRLCGLAVVAASVLAMIALEFAPTGYFVVRPGPVRSLGGVIAVEGYPPPATSFHMVSVVAAEANAYALVKAALDPEESIWTRRDVYGDKTPGEYVEESQALMERSQKNAALLAFRSSGFPLRPDDPMPSPISVASGEVLGPSAGLAFALEMVSILRKTDLAAGRKIAATGALDSEGRVGPVGGIAQKAIACREQGVELLLVPAANVAEASRYAGPVKVVGVGTLEEALAWLGEPGIP